MTIRLHVAAALAVGGRLSPEPGPSRYLTQVMRLGAGDHILVFNARDGEFDARLLEVSRRGCALELGERVRAPAPGPDLDLVVALIKRGPLETIVEKAAELGAARVRLALTQRTNSDRVNLARLQAIAVEAAEQTGRLDPPTVHAPERLERILQGWDVARRLMHCDEAGDDPAREWGGASGRAPPALEALHATSAIGAPARAEPWAILIGPEGGFAPEERARFRALDFAVAVSLGPRILRADTAAIAALTVWQAALGDWRAQEPAA